jgi:hypothetical protein
MSADSRQLQLCVEPLDLMQHKQSSLPLAYACQQLSKSRSAVVSKKVFSYSSGAKQLQSAILPDIRGLNALMCLFRFFLATA